MRMSRRHEFSGAVLPRASLAAAIVVAIAVNSAENQTPDKIKVKKRPLN